VWLCLQLISFLCFLGHVVMRGCVCYLYLSCVSYATLFGVCLCLLLTSFSCFLGEENGSVYYGSCCGVRGSFAEDTFAAEVLVRKSDANERRCTEHDFSHVPQGRGPHSE